MRNNAETIICQRAFPCETKIPVPSSFCFVRHEREPVTSYLSLSRKSLGICLAGKMRSSADLQIRTGKLVSKEDCIKRPYINMTYICKRKKFHEKIVSFGTLFRLFRSCWFFPRSVEVKTSLHAKVFERAKATISQSACRRSRTWFFSMVVSFYIFKSSKLLATNFPWLPSCRSFRFGQAMCNYPEHEMARSNPLKFSRGHYNLRFIPRAKQTASYLDFPAKGFITTSIALGRTSPFQNLSISGFVTVVSILSGRTQIHSSPGFCSST